MSIRSRAFPDEGGFVFDHQGEHAEHQGRQDRPSPLECRAGQPAAPTARPDATDRHDGHTAATPSGQIPLTNYVRMLTLAAGLLLMFFPGIIGTSATTFAAATGLDQTPYLTDAAAHRLLLPDQRTVLRSEHDFAATTLP